MDVTLRTRVEPLFGHVFEKVRIHTGEETAPIAESYGARAVTIGSDIVVDPRHVDLLSKTGQQILAHELAHVVQYERAGDPLTTGRSQRGDRAESEAHAAATSIMNGEPAMITANPTGAVAAWDLLDSIVGGGQALSQSFVDAGQFVGNHVFDAAQGVTNAATDTAPAAPGGFSPERNAQMKWVFDALQPMVDEHNRKRGVGQGTPEDKNPTAQTGATGLSPEHDRQMRYVLEALQPMVDENNRRRRDTDK